MSVVQLDTMEAVLPVQVNRVFLRAPTERPGDCREQWDNYVYHTSSSTCALCCIASSFGQS